MVNRDGYIGLTLFLIPIPHDGESNLSAPRKRQKALSLSEADGGKVEIGSSPSALSITDATYCLTFLPTEAEAFVLDRIQIL